MYFKHFGIQILVRLTLINLLIYLIYYLFKNTNYWFSIAGLCIILIGCIFSLYYYVNQIKLDLNKFLTALKHKDHTLNFSSKSTRGCFPEIYTSFNEIIRTQKNIQLENESMFELVKTILEKVPVGVIVLKLNENIRLTEVQFFNQSAIQLLAIPAYKLWHRIQEHLPQFSNEVDRIIKGGKRFIELKIQGKNVLLSVEVTPINLYDSHHVIISFQNIKDEIEQKETEVWNRLIGVISHEIMNSITPISSLSDTIHGLIEDKKDITADELHDLKLAIKTIRRRSQGLLGFVNDYRLIAELPTPQKTSHSLTEILLHIETLMRALLNSKNIRFNVQQTASKINLQLDFKLIEQVLINLITNSIYALEDTENGTIEIKYKLQDEKVHIDILDNGKGIDIEILEKIFLPFFTTKKGGSGIGLTIAKNIMKMHKGNLEVHSIPNHQTIFTLIFNVNK